MSIYLHDTPGFVIFWHRHRILADDVDRHNIQRFLISDVIRTQMKSERLVHRLIYMCRFNGHCTSRALLDWLSMPSSLCVASCISVAVNTINDAVGGDWKHTQFQPAIIARPSSSPIHVVMTVGYNEKYIPTFEGVGDFLQSNNGTLPELNHYVPLSADGANHAQARARKKFQHAAGEARTAWEAAGAKLTKTLEGQERSGQKPSRKRVELVSRLLDEQNTVRPAFHC